MGRISARGRRGSVQAGSARAVVRIGTPTVDVAGLLREGLAFHQAGRLPEAEARYRAVLDASPDYPDALHLIGVVAYQVGKPSTAAAYVARAIEGNGRVPAYHTNLGNALLALGRTPEAAAAYGRALALDSGNADAHYNLGNVRREQGKLDDAIRHLRRAAQLRPDHVDAHYNLGNALLAATRPEDAIGAYRRALDLRPDHAEAHNNLGTALRERGDADAALAQFERAIAHRPQFSEAHNNRGGLLRELGCHEDAVSAYRQAIALAPNDATLHLNLGHALRALDRFDEAAEVFRSALARAGDDVRPRRDLAFALHAAERTGEALHVLLDGLSRADGDAADALLRALAYVLSETRIVELAPALRRAMLDVCAGDTIDTQDLMTPIVALIRGAAGFPALLASARAGRDPYRARADLARFFGEELFHAALPGLIACDPDVELVLANLRRWALLRVTTATRASPSRAGTPARFLVALARHCFTTEYAFLVGADEAHDLDDLVADVERALARAGADELAELEPWLTVIAAYRPLASLAGAERLLATAPDAWSTPFRAIVEEQLGEPARERELAAALPSLTEVGAGVSSAVRAMYEANPYPRWRTMNRAEPETLADVARRLRPNEPVPDYPSPSPVLVAGAGTGRHPILTATRYRDVDVLAVDLSRASLAYGARMAERLDVDTVTFAHADLLRLDERDDLRGHFALIESIGVLHHLEDPLAGWAALLPLLRPGGLMKIGLYSEAARRGIVAAQRWVAERDFPTTPGGIRAARRAIMDLPTGHPALQATRFHDFYPASGFRDLVMHVQEQRFTTARLAECLDRLGLRFLGFEVERAVARRFSAMFPEPSAALDLACWGAYEEAYPETFATMYNLWCCPRQP